MVAARGFRAPSSGSGCLFSVVEIVAADDDENGAILLARQRAAVDEQRLDHAALAHGRKNIGDIARAPPVSNVGLADMETVERDNVELHGIVLPLAANTALACP